LRRFFLGKVSYFRAKKEGFFEYAQKVVFQSGRILQWQEIEALAEALGKAKKN